MEQKKPHLSIIVPVYRSAAFIEKSLDKIAEFLSTLAYSSELVVVDDGSPDNTRDVIEKWAAKQQDVSVTVVGYDKNRGKGGAVAAGMLEASGKYRVFMDADLAYPPSQVQRIVEVLEDGADVAIASRVHPDSRYTISPAFFHYLYTRHLASRVINWFMRRTIIPHCRDSQAGLKGFRAGAAEAIFSQIIIQGFSFDIEVLYLAERLGLSIREVGVEFRYFNEPTTVVFMQDGMGILRDIIKIRSNQLRGRYVIPKKNEGHNLIINADDFGMTKEISRGILEVVKAGLVKSTSVMTNSEAFEDSMNEIVKSGVLPDLGLHITLTWGRPLSDPKEIPTLVDADGKFWSKIELLKRAILHRVSEKDVFIELSKQCERLLSSCPEITHMDGHHHVHVYPVIAEAARRVARKYGIKYVRSPREGSWSKINEEFFRRLPMFLLKSASKAYWRGRGFLSSDNFGGFLLGASEDLKTKWQKTICKMPQGITEIMVHPGYASDNKDIYNSGREEELKLLTDQYFVNYVRSKGVTVMSCKDLIQNRE